MTPQFKRIGIPDKLVDHAKPDESYYDLGLTPPQIAEQILNSWFAKQEEETSVGVGK